MQAVGTQHCTHEDMANRLRASGITPTRPRVQIAQVLFERCEHISADQLLTAVNARAGRVSKATVYNTLNLFARKRLVREVLVDPDRVFYDPNTAPHHHFYNVDTGEISDIADDHIQFAQLPELPQGMVSDGVDVVVRVRSAGNTPSSN